MMHVKKGVRLHGIKPEIVFALVIADQVYSNLNDDLVIIDILDSQSASTSVYYPGGVVDLRLPNAHGIEARNRIALRIGRDYCVTLYDSYIRIEWLPKEDD